jgi:hypothetical protein
MSEDRLEPFVATPVTINIGANPDIRGTLQYTGANLIGPQIAMSLTSVIFGPAAALNFIGDEYGLIQLHGEVLFTGGSFGTITHPDSTIVAPNVNSYRVGTGTLQWQPQGTTGFHSLGNCQMLEFNQEATRLDHWEHMTGIRSKDFAPIVQQAATVTLHLDEWNAANLKLYFLDALTWP